MNEANKDSAQQCIDLATRALRVGNTAKAMKFCEKALKLYPTDAARALKRKVQQASGGSGQSGAAKPSQRVRAAGAARAAQGTGTAAGGDRRPCTQAQKDVVRKIKGTKNLYERIGVPRDVDASTLKKAYRKLSMKVHPDKNPAPGAEEAFQMLQKAYAILEDDQKRRYYDQTGEESAQAAAANRGGNPFGGGGFRGGPGFNFRGGNVHHVDMDDIFSQFFGAGMQMPGNRHGMRRGQRRQQQQQPRNQQQQQEERPQDSMGQFVFIIIMLLSLFSTSFQSAEPSVYSFQRTGEFSVERKTETGTSQLYYVRQNFESTLRRQRSWEERARYVARIDYEVDDSMQHHLERECKRQKEADYYAARKAVYNKNEAKANALKKKKKPACVKYNLFKKQRHES